ncbi:exodeoxyribonuclease VII large subunit [Maridesulfovibrio hydrothermalis]|uniref:Exodeoxyribonuclease 7 large subunit n=1 Tax=Maridesulfovibrio hydrothermalis AM13 = DSM 14728 TaxID=1121451 RepID=L0R8F4_9BACT|nr:exodeoxyribonuclease VII large subunit [Maridesulfovibrio hydrothermalis]CCO22455.1 Exodeoxyribonuclease 7 large subunit [Maridesulfovibrio hydrothermalis AM13 = DSM 14728]
MRIFSVTDITRAVKDVLETEFPFIWVKGQVTNLARPASGHIYFTLTDGDAGLSVVWFKGNQRSGAGESVNPLTGEVEEGGSLELEDGMEILCAGHMNVYPPRGVYQLVAELVQEQGVGDLKLAFEAMKRKLAEKGYFDDERKMEIPDSPKRVAVVTSPSGAAIRDFLKIAETRGTGAEIRIYPSLVQGDLAPAQIADALDQAGGDGWAEVVVLIRGGGSLEDLWAFNTESVADAIFRSTIPVVCGVGHEVDVSIADYVADKRVATPSHAAQELWPRRETLMQILDELELGLVRSYENFIDVRESRFDTLRKGLTWLSPAQRIERLLSSFEEEEQRLGRAVDGFFAKKDLDVENQDRRLAGAFGEDRILRMQQDAAALADRLERAGNSFFCGKNAEFENVMTSLRILDPESPLERGYSLVTVEKSGAFLRNPDEVAHGDSIRVRVKCGEVRARVVTE